jgi:predicted metalloendopeptidase
MIRGEEEARQACIEMIDKLIDDHKKNISHLEIMKEHVNDMTSEKFEEFALVFGYSMAPDMVKRTLGATATICAVNDTIVHIKEKEVE